METVEPSAGAVSSDNLPPQSTKSWRHKHILDLDDFTREEIEIVFETADAMSEILTREVKKVPTLRGKTIVTLFYEPSTRTRSSFELAAKNLSADTISLDSSKSSIVKGESLIDTLHTIQSLGADAIVMRHSYSGAPYLAAQHTDNVSIINAGDGWHAHPSQALLDLYTIRKHLRKFSDLKITIIGDIKHSRVARSNIWGMNTMGAKITLCAPPTLLPREFIEFINHFKLTNINIEPKIESALKNADVIMTLRLQLERQQSGLLPSLREYANLYQLNGDRLSLAKPNAIIMHPGPINEGIEISQEIAHGTQSVIDEQVTNGVAIRMALFYLVTGGKINEN
jgi:aspartate carbamoyltransferase catalytic subunit